VDRSFTVLLSTEKGSAFFFFLSSFLYYFYLCFFLCVRGGAAVGREGVFFFGFSFISSHLHTVLEERYPFGFRSVLLGICVLSSFFFLFFCLGWTGKGKG